MTVGESVRKAIDDWEQGEFESAMLHACNAIDGTASKLYPTVGSNARFTQLLRENYEIFGRMGAPGIDLAGTRWPVKVERPKAADGKPDSADVIYGIHRCTHAHRAALPDGFELLPDAAVRIEKGKVQLSNRIIFGLLAVAVMSPANTDQRVPDTYYLSFAGAQFSINESWGRAAEFASIVASDPMPRVTLNFTDWMNNP